MPVLLGDDNIKINDIVQVFDDVSDIKLNAKLVLRQGNNTFISSSGVISSTDTVYTLPIATSSVIGGIKSGGANVSINAAGVISSTDTIYTLPLATSSVLGGVRSGTNTSINELGQISSIVPSATLSVRGGIIVGNNLTISGDVLSGLAPPNLTPYRLITDSYTRAEVDTRDTNTSNVISTRLNNVYTKAEDDLFNTNNSNYTLNSSNVISTRITTLPFRLISDSYTSAEVDTRDTNTSNVISTRLNNVYTKTENNTQILNNSNYTLNSSNIISTRLSTLNANSISNGSTNKFIVNGIYSGNVNINGTLTANDLIIPGTITTLNTNIYATEQLQILNSSTQTALDIRQNNSLGDIINASNMTTEVFTIINNGNIGIGTVSPVRKLHVQGDINYTGGLYKSYNTTIRNYKWCC
jgi:hypothetical protein